MFKTVEQLYKIVKDNWSDRFLLLKVAILLILIRVGLQFIQFQTLRNLLAKIAQPKQNKQVSIYKIIWAITIVSPYIPGVKCLARAIAAQVILSKQNYPNQLRIGISKDNQGQFIAHAWVESRGKTVIGGIGNMTKYYNVLSLPEWEYYKYSKFILLRNK
ncbi:lasso peptide biosynthesis B2 protein [Pleurocapsa sp. PCC 7319]|uniref:lasso peptide biosynthesis B2 protein n=1 Tax=Pleurocapsa sp. PCC 7319 TaxID=118161 RepID=UPI000348FB95|nr:lasso peptide biosynthesis B2 protein [Pleurocapsa sp. PCC 7319]